MLSECGARAPVRITEAVFNSLAPIARPSYCDGMATVPRTGREKAQRPYRVEVTRRHKGAEPFGWQVYRRGDPRPIARSEHGFAGETAAWNAGASAMNRLERRKTDGEKK